MRLAVIPLLVVLAGSGCAVLAGLSDDSFSNGSTTATLSDGGTASDSGTSGPRVDSGAPAGAIVFVSSSGDDANDGASPAVPKKTIASGLAQAKANGRGGAVHVCAGTYLEKNLVLDAAISLQGGYDCVAFSRPVQVTTNDATTVIENGDYPAHPFTLVVTGAAVTESVVVDGFTIRGAAGGATVGGALLVGDRAAPRIVHGVFEAGGTGGAATAESVGVRLDGAGKVLFAENVVQPGDASKTPNGAIGLELKSLAEALVGDHAIRGNRIRAAGGGLSISGSTGVEVVENDIDAGTRSCAKACELFGVRAINGSAITIARNRIYGGDIGATGSIDTLRGVFVEGTGAPVIAQNAIVTGNDLARPLRAIAGILVNGGANGKIDFNTVATVSNHTESAQGIGVYAHPEARVRNNLVIGNAGGSFDVGFVFDLCKTAVAEFRSNAIVRSSYAGLTYLPPAPTCAGAADPFADAFTARLGSAASSNRRYVEACNGDTACTPCGTATACIPALFDFSAPDKTALFSDVGLRLRKGTACTLKSNGTLPADYPTDIVGKARKATPSVGAYEFDDTCL